MSNASEPCFERKRWAAASRILARIASECAPAAAIPANVRLARKARRLARAGRHDEAAAVRREVVMAAAGRGSNDG